MSFDEELRKIGAHTSEARRLEEEGKIEEAVELLTQLSQQLQDLSSRAETTSLRGVLKKRSMEYASNATHLKRKFITEEAKDQPLTDQQGLAAVQIVRGPEVTSQLLEMLQSAQYRVLIATHQIHPIDIAPEGEAKAPINLLTLLNELHEAGVKIRIITTPPAQLPGVARWKQADALRTLVTNGIEFRLCSRIHFNSVLVDDTAVWRGSAPLTETGLAGLDDVVEYSTAPWLKAVYLDLFRNRWERSDETCTQCYEKTCLAKWKSEDPRRNFERTITS